MPSKACESFIFYFHLDLYTHTHALHFTFNFIQFMLPRFNCSLRQTEILICMYVCMCMLIMTFICNLPRFVVIIVQQKPMNCRNVLATPVKCHQRVKMKYMNLRKSKHAHISTRLWIREHVCVWMCPVTVTIKQSVSWAIPLINSISSMCRLLWTNSYIIILHNIYSANGYSSYISTYRLVLNRVDFV